MRPPGRYPGKCATGCGIFALGRAAGRKTGPHFCWPRSMKALAEQIADLDSMETYGRVVGVCGLMVEVAGPIHAMSVGARLSIETGIGPAIPCEVVGFTGGHAGHAVCRARRRAARLPGGGR